GAGNPAQERAPRRHDATSPRAPIEPLSVHDRHSSLSTDLGLGAKPSRYRFLAVCGLCPRSRRTYRLWHVGVTWVSQHSPVGCSCASTTQNWYWSELQQVSLQRKVFSPQQTPFGAAHWSARLPGQQEPLSGQHLTAPDVKTHSKRPGAQ